MAENEKLPPHDIAAEESVIGSLLIDGSVIYDIATVLQKTDFYHAPLQLLYDACLTLYQRNETINQITVAQELDRRGKLEECGGVAYLSHLISVVPTSLDAREYAGIVYRLSISRRLITAGQQISSIGYEAKPDAEESISKAEDVLFKLQLTRGPGDFQHVRQVLDKYFEPRPAHEEDGTPGVITKINSAFKGLDSLTTGFQPSDLIIVAGRPSVGKTTLAMNIARNAAVEQGACVAIFSVEMSSESLVLRLLSSEASVLLSNIRLGQHSEMEERKIMDAIGILSEAQIYIDDSPRLRISEMRSKARRLMYERGINLIVIDHLGLMEADARMDNRVQEISFISRSLKALARDLKIPVIAVSQLSRASEMRTTHKPQLSDLRDSGSIEQDADMVTLVYREDYYYPTEEDWRKDHPDEEYPAGIATVILAKNRNGPTGEVNLRFNPKYARFENIANQEPSLL
ncbi:MAG: replicative DNA helicase [Dehalococcoidales bacterium]|nr:replicative DNA helicase [Dehalococcoidales bacterium]